MSDKKHWFETGYGGAEREQEKRDIGSGPKRWYLGEGKTKDLVFVDDSPFCFDEHQWKTESSKFPNFAACVAKIVQDGCSGCTTRGVQKAEYTGHLTSVDISGYTNKDGKEIKYELVEFCPKLKVMNKLKMRKQTKGSLIGQMYSVSRTDRNAPNTGDDFDFIRDVKMDELYKLVTYYGKNVSEMISKANGTGEEAAKVRRFLAHHFQIPETGEIPAAIPVFNYFKLHEPLETADFRKAVAGAVGYDNNDGGRRSSGGGSSGGGTADDSVPF